MTRTLLRAAVLSAAVLVLSTADASAGPLKRLRDRIKGNGCGSVAASTCSQSAPQATFVTAPATQAFTATAVSGCANGQCPVQVAPQYRRTIFAK